LTENNEAGHEKIEEKGINADVNGEPITDNDDNKIENEEKSESLIDETQIGDQPEVSKIKLIYVSYSNLTLIILKDATSVKRKRFSLKRLFRRSPKKNEKRSKEVPVTENLVTESDAKMTENVEAGHENIQEKGIIGDENEKQVPTQEPINECPANDIKIDNDEKLSIGDVSSEKSEPPVDEILKGDQPEVSKIKLIYVSYSNLIFIILLKDDIVSVKRKGFFLKKLFKRSPKKNTKVSEVLPVTENLVQESDAKMAENNVEEGHESEVEKIEEKEINDEENGKEAPAQEPINECSANDINIVDHEELPKEDLPSEKLESPIDEIQNGDQPEVSKIKLIYVSYSNLIFIILKDGTVAEKHKGFSLKRLFRRSPKKNEKPLKAVPVTENLIEEKDAKVAENSVEEGHESGVEIIEEKGINGDENGQQIPTQEPINENPGNDIKIDNDEKLSFGDVPSEIAEKSESIDAIQNGDQPEVSKIKLIYVSYSNLIFTRFIFYYFKGRYCG